MSRLALLSWGFIVAFVACQSGDIQSLTDAERAAITKEINTRFEAWATAVREADLDKILTFFTSDIQVGDNGRLYTGRDEVDRAFRPYFARIEKQDIQADQTSISVLSPGIAIQTARCSIPATDTIGVTSDRRVLALTVVWVKRDRQWLVAQFHQSVAPMQN